MKGNSTSDKIFVTLPPNHFGLTLAENDLEHTYEPSCAC